MDDESARYIKNVLNLDLDEATRIDSSKAHDSLEEGQALLVAAFALLARRRFLNSEVRYIAGFVADVHTRLGSIGWASFLRDGQAAIRYALGEAMFAEVLESKSFLSTISPLLIELVRDLALTESEIDSLIEDADRCFTEARQHIR
ncbi:hypothetical protein GCM10023322_68550 [Rugosimonospora acidiphila]|uniref:Uncharacterized protein n=1 Tax=Rugosimonospora acidiphila TaxID=556531 RepID=A0ABP9SMJ8_9ACTN